MPRLTHQPVFALSALLAVAFCAPAEAQVVQLPQFDYFSVQSSVLVPDRGGVYMGGVGQSSSSSSTSGVPLLGRVPGLNRGFQNRSFGHSVSGGGVSVHATIIDLAEMDRAILAAAQDGRAAPSETAQLNQHAGVLAREVADTAEGGELLSVAEIRRQQQAAAGAEEERTLRHYADGQVAEAQGEYGLACVYYRLALQRASGPLAEEISARLAYATSAGRPTAER